jgi:hypothetical protein
LIVIPAKAGIHTVPQQYSRFAMNAERAYDRLRQQHPAATPAWIPAFAGMTAFGWRQIIPS